MTSQTHDDDRIGGDDDDATEDALQGYVCIILQGGHRVFTDYAAADALLDRVNKDRAALARPPLIQCMNHDIVYVAPEEIVVLRVVSPAAEARLIAEEEEREAAERHDRMFGGGD